MTDNREFEAEKELLKYFSELPRGKATQILTVVGMFFVYFQIALDSEIRANRFLYEGRLSWPSILELKFIPISFMPGAFGILTITLVWHIFGLIWYVGMEQQFFLERSPITISDNERPFVKVYNSITSAAQSTLQYGPFHHLSGFRVYTAFLIPLGSCLLKRLGVKKYKHVEKPKDMPKRLLWLIIVLFLYWLIMFPLSIGLIRLVLSI